MEAAGFFYRALRVFGKLGRDFEADETSFAAGGFVFGKANVAGCLYVGNRHGFVALFGAEVLLLEGGDLVGVKRVAGKGFLEDGGVGSYAAHALFQHLRQFAALYERAGKVVQPDLLS